MSIASTRKVSGSPNAPSKADYYRRGGNGESFVENIDTTNNVLVNNNDSDNRGNRQDSPFQKQEEKIVVWKENFDYSDISTVWNEETTQRNIKWSILNANDMQTLLDPLLPIPYNNEYAYIMKNNFFDTTSYINLSLIHI